jgi:hypothetical protein
MFQPILKPQQHTSAEVLANSFLITRFSLRLSFTKNAGLKAVTAVSGMTRG